MAMALCHAQWWMSSDGAATAVNLTEVLWQTGAAEEAELVLFFAGITMLNERECQTTDQAPAWVPFLEGEGLDRHDLNLPASQVDTLQVRTRLPLSIMRFCSPSARALLVFWWYFEIS